jgi:hypothetical protein
VKTLTNRELEIKRVELAMLKTDLRIAEARVAIAAMQRKQRARRKEIARQLERSEKKPRNARNARKAARDSAAGTSSHKETR